MTTSTETSTTVGARAVAAARRALVDELDGPLPAMLVALTVLAGVVDATSVLRLGHVFVATATGNLVFLGLAVAGARGFGAGVCAVSLGGFVVGAALGGRVCRASGAHRGRALRNVLVIKATLAAAVTAAVLLTAPTLAVGTRDGVVVALAASMGCQLALIRHLKVPDLMTAVMTLTITGVLTEWDRGWLSPTMVRRWIALVAFAVGALSGALLVLHVSTGAGLALGLAIILAVAVAAHLASRSSADWAAPR